jgi:sulfite reductase (NADPH) flavoprotein alpha-component
MRDETLRLSLAALAVGLYGLLCLLPAWLQVRRARRARPRTTGAGWLVAYASQTGNAQDLTGRTVATLAAGGVAAQACALDELDAEMLARAERALFIVSTYGEGDPPDNAAGFVRRLLGQSPDLRHLHVGVLALGDRTYAHFCGFGATLEAWLQACGAAPMFERIDADRLAPAALRGWQEHLSHLIGTADAPDWTAPASVPWRLAARTLLNPGSAGEPVCRLRFVPGQGPLPDWEAGDLVQLAPPGDDRPRDYSIASVPADGGLDLLVRLQRHADGSVGRASSWLTAELPVDATIRLRIRSHPRFRIGENARRPLLLIGNGTGMAGLRAHLRARQEQGGAPCWLLFGERSAARDDLYGDEVRAWQQTGLLARCDLVWSRDGGPYRYVQDRLLAEGAGVRDWIARGAAVYVCGSLEGMAAGVDAALREILGADAVDSLADAGRYRRDVY